MNIERPATNVEGNRLKTEELIKIFIASIKTAVRQPHGPEWGRRAGKKKKQ
jgi:hypothetical protein